MKAIRIQRPGVLAVEDLPTPEPGPGQVRMRTLCCGVCATDLEMIAGWERTPYPAIPGHEWCGVVDAVGRDLSARLLGRRCVGDNILPCQTCSACHLGHPANCTRPREVGFELPGGYAEYFLTNADKLRFLPEGLPSAVATLAEPLAVVMRGLGRLHNALEGTPALVFGDGPIGLLAVLALRSRGADPLVLVGGRERRLEQGRAFGAMATLYYKSAGDQLADILRSVSPEGYPLGVEATGRSAAFELLFAMMGKNAELLVLGDYRAASAAIRLNHLLLNEIRVVGSNTGTGGWDAAVPLLGEYSEALGEMITHEFAAQDFESALAAARSKSGDLIKAVLRWGQG